MASTASLNYGRAFGRSLGDARKRIAIEQVVVLIATVHSEVHGKGHRMPLPKVILAVLVFFGFLGAVAELGADAARTAAAIGGVVTLGALVGGATGRDVVDLLKWSAGVFGGRSAPISGSTVPTSSTGGSDATVQSPPVGYSIATAPASLRPARP